MMVTKLEDCEAHKNTFELNGMTSQCDPKYRAIEMTGSALNNSVRLPAGTLFDRLQVICTNQQDLQDWVEHLTRQIKHATATAPSHKPLTVPCHTVST